MRGRDGRGAYRRGRDARTASAPRRSRAGASLTVASKKAGLGSETQVNIEVSAEAACLNPGQNFPSAESKETFTAAGTFPVQNGKALFSLTLTATFQPKCSPPMTVVFGDVTVTDVKLGVTTTIAGPFQAIPSHPRGRRAVAAPRASCSAVPGQHSFLVQDRCRARRLGLLHSPSLTTSPAPTGRIVQLTSPRRR